MNSPQQESVSPTSVHDALPLVGGSRSLRDWHVHVAIILLGCIVYAKSIFYQFTYFDDAWFLDLNRGVLINLRNVAKIFTTDVFISFRNPEAYYRPFLNLLFMVEMQFAGNSLVTFHITNILLHIGCSLLVFAVFKQLRVSRMIAAASALLFCAAPLNTSAVVWIPGSNDSLLALFILVSLSFFLLTLNTRRLLPLLGHFLFFFFALLTKENAIVLPLLCIAYLLVVSNERPGLGKGVLLIAGYILLVGIWFVLRSSATRTLGADFFVDSLALNLLRTSPAFLLYVGKVFLPLNLSVLPDLKDHSLIPGIISVLVVAATLFARKPSSYKTFWWGMAWFVLFMVPTFLSSSILYEHRAYCALVGLLFALTQLPLVQSLESAETGRILGFVAILLAFSAIAMVHSEDFRNRTSFATTAYAKDPSVDASQAALADLFVTEGNDTAAERALQLAIAKDSSMKLVHRRLADIYAKRREYALATTEYKTAIRIDSLDLYAYIDYGWLCLQEGRLDDASHLWRKAITANPEFLVGYRYLATFYAYNKHDPDSAMIYVKQIQQRGATVMPQLLHEIEDELDHRKTKE